MLVLMTACGGGGGRYGDYDDYAADADAAAEEARQAVYEDRGADSDGTGADASNVDAYDVEDGGNYVCTEDCAGHEAGFAWAQENDVTDASECGSDSMSFAEGCEAFAEERQEQADREAQEAAEQAAEDASYEADQEAEYEDDRSRLIDGRY
ncbi:hypothetical protein IAE60_15535 [Pseudoxanthomonas mexicana]|uniref:Uncharacterized protein n=1 Tax=Pseudoxanthomonas mexicana TaxID=128785 RepID=A0A7G9TB40_PSEMX|nr:hypothetical protein [Pseudoxanthomonas mexicana]QNN77315.1 hypothetical protein IAE60_15535 [Pseudoxanthomonas mexicana]